MLITDPEECAAIDNVFCKGRKTPLLVGSVKSNIGHSESCAGACSVAKVVLAFENGIVPPNINFTKVRPGIKSLEEGRLVVCTEPTKLEGSLVGINAFGFGGANAHTLLSEFFTLGILTNDFLKPQLSSRRTSFQGEIKQRGSTRQNSSFNNLVGPH